MSTTVAILAVALLFVAINSIDATISTCAIEKGKCNRYELIICEGTDDAAKPVKSLKGLGDGVCSKESLWLDAETIRAQISPSMKISCAIKCKFVDNLYAVCIKVNNKYKNSYWMPVLFQTDKLQAAITAKLGGTAVTEPKQSDMCT